MAERIIEQPVEHVRGRWDTRAVVGASLLGWVGMNTLLLSAPHDVAAVTFGIAALLIGAIAATWAIPVGR